MDRPSTFIKPPPDGWREIIDKNDELIGYISRRMEQRENGITLSYSTIRSVLFYLDKYKEEKNK